MKRGFSLDGLTKAKRAKVNSIVLLYDVYLNGQKLFLKEEAFK